MSSTYNIFVPSKCQTVFHCNLWKRRTITISVKINPDLPRISVFHCKLWKRRTITISVKINPDLPRISARVINSHNFTYVYNYILYRQSYYDYFTFTCGLWCISPIIIISPQTSRVKFDCTQRNQWLYVMNKACKRHG